MSRPKKPKDKTSRRYTLEEAERLQNAADYITAWLEKYGWSVEEAPRAQPRKQPKTRKP
jgi:hypothetical protein